MRTSVIVSAAMGMVFLFSCEKEEDPTSHRFSSQASFETYTCLSETMRTHDDWHIPFPAGTYTTYYYDTIQVTVASYPRGKLVMRYLSYEAPFPIELDSANSYSAIIQPSYTNELPRYTSGRFVGDSLYATKAFSSPPYDTYYVKYKGKKDP
jgi:hypothetical protein